MTNPEVWYDKLDGEGFEEHPIHAMIRSMTPYQMGECLHRLATTGLDWKTLADNRRWFDGKPIDDATARNYRGAGNVILGTIRLWD